MKHNFFEDKIQRTAKREKAVSASFDKYQLENIEFVDLEHVTGIWRDFTKGITNGLKAPGLFVYVHTPYCVSKCKYCFYKSVALRDQGYLKSHIQRLETEASLIGETTGSLLFDGAYFGGGTPSIYDEKLLSRMLRAVFKSFRFKETGLITMEMRADSATPEKMSIAKEAGVNRISFGVQSASETVLHLAGRGITAEKTKYTLSVANAAGFKLVNIDLLTPLPGETVSSFARSVDEYASCGTDTINLYRYVEANNYEDYKIAPNPELADWDRTSDIFTERVAKHGYEILKAYSWSLIAVRKDRAAEPLLNPKLNYEMTGSKGSSIVGIGSFAKSNVFGKARYYNCGINVSGDSGKPDVYSVFRKNMDSEARTAIVRHLEHNDPLSRSEFIGIFNVDPFKAFEKELDFLIDRNWAQVENDLVTWNIGTPDDPGMIAKIFYNDEMPLLFMSPEIVSESAAIIYSSRDKHLRQRSKKNASFGKTAKTDGWFSVTTSPLPDKQPFASNNGFFLYYSIPPENMPLLDEAFFDTIDKMFNALTSKKVNPSKDKIESRINEFGSALTRGVIPNRKY